MDEAYVQIAADGAGKKIRNLKITERSVDLEGTETFVDRYAQVTAITDSTGNVLDFNQAELLMVLRDIRMELVLMNLQLRSGFEGRLPDVKTELAQLRSDAGACIEDMERFR